MNDGILLYAPLPLMRLEVKTSGVEDTSDDDTLIQLGRLIAERIDLETDRTFAPYRKTARIGIYAANTYSIGSAEVLLSDTLLSVISLVNDTNIFTTADYALLPDDGKPYESLSLAPASGFTWDIDGRGRRVAYLTLDGVWGYRENYARAWVSSKDTVRDNPLTIDADVITVTDINGLDVLRRTPRFSPGQLLRLGVTATAEWVEVIDTAINGSIYQLYVVRGAHGSTATEHLQGTAISIFEVEPNIQRAAMRWAAYLLKRRGTYEQVRFEGVATITIPQDIPEEVENILEHYRSTKRKSGPILGV